MYPDRYRKPLRLAHYDYSQSGLYYITVCTKNREPLFGTISSVEFVGVDPRSALIKNVLGEIVENTWFDLANHNAYIQLHEFVVMPNHIHGIIEIDVQERVDVGSTPTKRPLSEIVRQFKSFSTRRINQLRNTSGMPVWQRNYYEQVIRNEESYLHIAEYIVNNPLQWQVDELYMV
jgi:REP element-mobilizing transposase RayT